MIDTSTHIWQLTIHSPITALTDYIISGITFYFFFQLNRLKNKSETIINWKRFFFFMSMSTFLGGTTHAFFPIQKDNTYHLVFWLGMQITNCIAVYLAQRATLVSVLKNSIYKNQWKISYIIQLMIFIPVIVFFQNYLLTIIENAIGLIPIMLLHYHNKEKNKSNIKIGHSIAFSFITVIIHATRLSINDYFNYKDLAHVLLMVSLTIMYIGIKEKAISKFLRDQ